MADIITDFLTHCSNCIRAKKREIEWYRVSNLLINVLEVMKRHGYIEYYKVENLEGGKKKVIVKLADSFNKAGAIKPRFPVQKKDWEWYEKIYLPARDFGILIVSTSQGVMSHKEAKKKGIGGILIGYVY